MNYISYHNFKIVILPVFFKFYIIYRNLNEDLHIIGEYSKKLVDATRTEIEIPDVLRLDEKEEFNNEVIQFQKTPKNSRITRESITSFTKRKDSMVNQEVVNFKSFQILKVIGAGAFGKMFLVFDINFTIH